MSLRKKQFIAISLGFFLAGWIGGFIVAFDKDDATVLKSCFAVNPYRGAFASVLVGWFLIFMLTKISENRFHWIWNTILSPIITILAVQTHFLIWPEDWHGRAESYKTTIIFLQSYWHLMLPIALITMHSLGFLFRHWNLDDLVEDLLTHDETDAENLNQQT